MENFQVVVQEEAKQDINEQVNYVVDFARVLLVDLPMLCVLESKANGGSRCARSIKVPLL